MVYKLKVSLVVNWKVLKILKLEYLFMIIIALLSILIIGDFTTLRLCFESVFIFVVLILKYITLLIYCVIFFTSFLFFILTILCCFMMCGKGKNLLRVRQYTVMYTCTHTHTYIFSRIIFLAVRIRTYSYVNYLVSRCWF